jgi:hypothetical protein
VLYVFGEEARLGISRMRQPAEGAQLSNDFVIELIEGSQWQL